MANPETVLVAPVAGVHDDPVYHLPDRDGRPRCTGEDYGRYREVDADEIGDGFRCCRSCDPAVHVRNGGGALCDVLDDLDPDDVGERSARGD